MGTGPLAAIYLHGFGASLDTWGDLRPLLDPDACTHYFLDLKGFGHSSKPSDGAYGLEDHARIVIAFSRRLELARPAVVGHAYGGLVALAAAALDEGRALEISKLVLLDVDAYGQREALFVRLLRTPVARKVLLGGLLPARQRARVALARCYHDARLATDERVERVARLLESEGARASLVAAAEQTRAEDYERIVSRCGELDIPTLIIWGREDRIATLETAERLHGELDNSRLRVIERCGHLPHEERPEEVAQLLGRFLRQART